MELHGGSLTVESTPDIGTTMIAHFPRRRLVSAAAA
jgi:signal transduction histidine kinase